MKRASGILMPVFSLPSAYGIGGFGKESYEFIDFLAEAGQKVWQMLPLVQTGYGNSPYSSVSLFSFNPFFIDPEELVLSGLLKKSEIKLSVRGGRHVDYGFLYDVRYGLLRKAFSRFDKGDAKFKSFIRSGEFSDYAIFMAAKTVFASRPFYEWEEGVKYRRAEDLKKFKKDNKDEITFWHFVQYTAKSQWSKLKKYAGDKGVKIVGDMPLYAAPDSADVWANPGIFKLNDDLTVSKEAGVPPDYFSQTGQLWGNPVYDYDRQPEIFDWWFKRIRNALDIFDYVRIDHFRGLDRYYEVPSGAENAVHGEWVQVPSEELFAHIGRKDFDHRIIAEDLGIIDDGVRQLLKKTGYPGMKILSFAFNGDPGNLYLPERIDEHCVCYTGTHDNDTLAGLIANMSEWDYNNLVKGVANSLEVMNVRKTLKNNLSLAKAITELGMKSRADLFVMPYQDVLLKDSEYRINIPGTVSGRNFSVRFDKKDFSHKTAERLKKLTEKYNRIPK